MPERDGYIPGVPCWVIVPAFYAPWSTPTYTIRITVIADPQGATFIASEFVPEKWQL